MASNSKGVDNLLGNPRRALLTMSLPLLFAMLVENLQTFVDRIWCSGLGSDELSAISISSTVYGMITAIGTGLGVGVSAAIARYIGAKDKGSADRSASISIVMIFLVSLLVSGIMFFAAEPIVRFIGNNANVDLCLDYCRPYVFLAFFLMMNGIWAGLLRSEGAAKVSMVLSLSASVINMVLDPIMIYGLDMGLTGASIATCISYIAMSCIGFWWYLTRRSYLTVSLKNVGFDRRILSDIFIVGIPVCIEMLVINLLMMPENALVVRCGGTDGLTVYVTAFHILSLLIIPASALGKSLIPIMSAAIGQRDYGKINECIKLTFKISVAIEFVAMVVVFAGADFFDGLFINSESMEPLRDEMVYATRVFCIICVFHAIRLVGTSVLQALRHAGLSTIISVTREVMFIVAYYFAGQVSMKAIYWSVDLVNLCIMAVVWVMVYYGLKKFKHEIELEQTISQSSQ